MWGIATLNKNDMVHSGRLFVGKTNSKHGQCFAVKVLSILHVCMCVLPRDSGPAISSPTSPAEEVETCPGPEGQGASHNA